MAGGSAVVIKAAAAKIEVGDGVAFGITGDVLFAVFQANSSIARDNWAADHIDAALDRDKDRSFILIVVILPESAPPDSAGRANSQRRMKRFKQGVRQFITLPLGDTFRGSIVRTIMRAMVLVTGQSSTHTVVADEKEALKIARQAASAQTPPEAQLRATLASIYEKLGVPTPAGFAITQHASNS